MAFVKVVEGQLIYNFAIEHLAYLCFKILSKTQLKYSKPNFQTHPSELCSAERAVCNRRARQRRGPRAVGPAQTSRSNGLHAVGAGALGGASTTFLTHPARATRAAAPPDHWRRRCTSPPCSHTLTCVMVVTSSLRHCGYKKAHELAGRTREAPTSRVAAVRRWGRAVNFCATLFPSHPNL
jgi:hypothetical protein